MYEVPKSKKSLKQNQFEFKLNGKTYSVPLMKYIKPSIAMRAMSAPPAEQVRIILEEYIGETVFDQFDDMEQIDDWMNALQEASGITVGESPASTDS
jgi:hypothetical protein